MSTEINIKKKLAILNEGASVTTDASSIDFVGSGVSASNIDGDITVTIPGGSGTTTYYLNQTVTQAPYKEFSSVATAAAEQVVPLTVLAGATSVIAEFQTPTSVPNTTQIPGGLWQFFLHFNAGSAGQNWIIRPTVYKRDLGGTETLLFTPDPEIVTNMSTTTTMYISDGVFPSTTLVTTDRIVVKISVENTTGVSQTVNFRTEGSQHYSVGLTTLNQVISGGSVTSVTGTAPIVSSGGTTPAISIPLATGSANGYLSSSDWSTFSAKLGGSGTINRLSKWISSTALGNSLFEDDGTSIAIGTNPSASIKLDVYSTLVQSIRGVNGSTSVGNKTAIEGTANGANGTNIGGYFYAQNATNNYSIWLQDGTQGIGKVLTCITSDGKANWVTPSSAGSGVCGIANSSGVYTYYATLSLAITAATSGQTVDLLTDITETGSVTLSMKAGVKINGNGYTYTLSVNDDSNAMVNGSSLLIELYNLKVVRTGRSANAGGRVFGKNDTGSLLHLKCQNVVFENTYGVGVGANVAIIYGLTVNAYGEGVTAPYDSTGLNNCIITSSTSYGVYLPNSGSDIVNCDVTGSIFGMHAGFGTVYNSIGKTTSGTGIQATRVVNSTGTSSSGTGISTNNGNNCVGISTSGVGLSGTFRNSTGISTSGYGCSGTFETCTLISSSNYALQSGGTVYMYNSYAESTSSPVTARANIYNSTVRCLWNNAGGSCTNSFALASHEVVNSFLEVSNTSAYCITGYIGSTWKFGGNTYKGATTAVNTTNVTQGITNTSDNQGNILI